MLNPKQAPLRPRAVNSMAESPTFNRVVQGSSPWRPTHRSVSSADRATAF